MDRNAYFLPHLFEHVDVPRKGNVDRNAGFLCEIEPLRQDVPRKGNVDRNILGASLSSVAQKTFPARGTWIEIMAKLLGALSTGDVPRKGNVDRNDVRGRLSRERL